MYPDCENLTCSSFNGQRLWHCPRFVSTANICHSNKRVIICSYAAIILRSPKPVYSSDKIPRKHSVFSSADSMRLDIRIAPAKPTVINVFFTLYLYFSFSDKSILFLFQCFNDPLFIQTDFVHRKIYSNLFLCAHIG